MGSSIWGTGGTWSIPFTSIAGISPQAATDQYWNSVAATQAMRQAEIARTQAEAARTLEQSQALKPAYTDPYIKSIYDKYEAERAAAEAARRTRYESALTGYQNLANQQTSAIAGVPQSYQDIANAYKQRTSDLSGYLEGFGATQQSDLLRQYQQAQAQTAQSLMSRGLTGATTYDAIMRGLGSDYARNTLSLGESLNRQRMDYLSALTGEALQAQAAVPQATVDVAGKTLAMQQLPLELQAGYQERAPQLGDISAITKTLWRQ